MNGFACRLGGSLLLGLCAVAIAGCDLVSDTDRGEVSLKTDKTLYAPGSRVKLRLENDSDAEFVVSSLCQLKIQRFEKLSWIAMWQLESCYAGVISVEAGDSFEFDLDLPESLPGGSLRYSLGGVGSNSFTIRLPVEPHPPPSLSYAKITTEWDQYEIGEEIPVRIDNVSDVDLYLFHTCGQGLQKLRAFGWNYWLGCANFFPWPPDRIPPGQSIYQGVTLRDPGTFRYVIPLGVNDSDTLPPEETTSNVFHVGEPTRGANRQ